MIDLIELHQEQADIANLIIETLYGGNPIIPYFTYHGPCEYRDSAMIGKRGIYIFTMIEEIELSNEMIIAYNNALNWNSTLVGAGFNYPFPNKLNIGDVFYLGKVSCESSSLYQRLKVHYGGRTDSATNGIKMKMPERNFVEGKLLVHTFLFDKNHEEVMKIIIDPVEKILHQKLHPKTGGSQ